MPGEAAAAGGAMRCPHLPQKRSSVGIWLLQLGQAFIDDTLLSVRPGPEGGFALRAAAASGSGSHPRPAAHAGHRTVPNSVKASQRGQISPTDIRTDHARPEGRVNRSDGQGRRRDFADRNESAGRGRGKSRSGSIAGATGPQVRTNGFLHLHGHFGCERLPRDLRRSTITLEEAQAGSAHEKMAVETTLIFRRQRALEVVEAKVDDVLAAYH